jgi:hypothetical protein
MVLRIMMTHGRGVHAPIIFRLLSLRDFVRGLDKPKAWEAGRTTFAIIGAAGYAGYWSAMHIVMAAVSLCIVTGSCYGIYG